MDIRSVMTANPACCKPGATLQEVARLMRENDCGEIPVIEDNKPVGVITDRDIAVRAVAEGQDVRRATVGDYMTAPVLTLRDNSSLEECYRLMEDKQIRRVVVVDQQGSVQGIVSQADIALSGSDAKTAEVVKQVSNPT